MVLGKALSEEYLISVHFTTALYKLILGIPLSLQDLEQVDPQLYKSLTEVENEDPTDLYLTFSVQEENFGEMKTYELVEGGEEVEVTEENKKDYIRRIVNWKLTHGIENQLNSLKKGFYSIVPPAAVKGFSAREFEQLLLGTPDLDLDDWKKNTQIYHSDPSSVQFKWFWEIVEDMSDEERISLLQFVTGSSSAPYGGFANLLANGRSRKFTLHIWETTPNKLPQAHTCFNQLDIPPYKSRKEFAEKLRLALFETAGMELV